jgi:hypothetical protein
MPTLRTFLVFALLGPPLGSAIYTVGLIAGHIAKGQPSPPVDEAVMIMLFTAPFSYVFGLVPALLTATLLLAGPRLFNIRPGLPYAVATGFACGVVFALIFLPGADESGLGKAGYFALKVLTCLVPSLICWWLARPKRADADDTGHEAVRS